MTRYELYKGSTPTPDQVADVKASAERVVEDMMRHPEGQDAFRTFRRKTRLPMPSDGSKGQYDAWTEVLLEALEEGKKCIPVSEV